MFLRVEVTPVGPPAGRLPSTIWWATPPRHGFAPWPHDLAVCIWLLPEHMWPLMPKQHRLRMRKKRRSALRPRREDKGAGHERWTKMQLRLQVLLEVALDVAAAADAAPDAADVPQPFV